MSDPLLYQQLADGWIAAGMVPEEWESALREACRNREYWLESLIKSVGLSSVTEVFEDVLLRLDVARQKERIHAKGDVDLPATGGMT